MLYHQLIYGTGLIMAIVIFHVAVLVWLGATLQRWEHHHQIFDKKLGRLGAFSFSVFVIIGVHTVEAWFWAYIYLILGEFSSMQDALYFSISTATTVGYGDVVMSEEWRLLSTFEAMGGWLLFGASTAFLAGLMRYMFTDTTASE